MKSQSVISSGGWGGRRTPPRAFTEHGVVLAVSFQRSEVATAIMHHVVTAFIEARKPSEHRHDLVTLQERAKSLEPPAGLDRVIERLIAELDKPQRGPAVPQEILSLFGQALDHVRSRLGRATAENEEIAARTIKLIAEANNIAADTDHKNAQTERFRLKTWAAKMKLLLAMKGTPQDQNLNKFLAVLQDMQD